MILAELLRGLPGLAHLESFAALYAEKGPGCRNQDALERRLVAEASLTGSANDAARAAAWAAALVLDILLEHDEQPMFDVTKARAAWAGETWSAKTYRATFARYVEEGVAL